jgi:hypothetical protein
MSANTSQLGTRARVAWAIALWLVAGVAAPAAATPVTLYFDGPSGYGVAEGDALTSGVPIEEPPYVVDAAGILRVVDQDVQLGSIDPFPPIAASANSLTSTWTVENESSYDLLGDTYILFATTVAYAIGGEVVEYDDSDVGLSIDPDLGWVLIHTNAGPGEDYYFPAMLLGSLVPGEVAAPFAVNFVVDAPMQQVGNTFVLPQFQTGLGFAPIPEPGAATLMCLGLVLLATFGRQRS